MPRPTADAALEHASWLRSLAESLVRDPAAADDLVQETWLRALERPPRAGGSLRGWLGRVLTNQARQRWRGEGRRRHHERAGARREAVDPSDDLDERFALQRTLMEAIGELDDKSREVVLLRFFDELPPRAIAARLDVPVKTVDTRLRRALERLRGRLDREWDGDRRAWVLALASFADRRSAPTLLSVGATIVGLKWIAGVAAAALVAVAGWNLLPQGRPVDVEAPATADLAAVPASARAEDAAAAGEAAAPAREELGVVLAASAAEAAAEPIVGRVVLPDGGPAPGATVQFVAGYSGEGDVGASAVADAFGVFEIERPEHGGRLECNDGEYATAVLARVHHDTHFEPVVLVGVDRPLAGTVVDPDGRPIAGAGVVLELPEGMRSQVEAVFEGSDLVAFRTHADEEGRWSLPRRPVVPGARLRIAHDDYEEHVSDPPGDAHDHLRTVLTPLQSASGVLDGIVLDAEGEPVEGAMVALGHTVDQTDGEGRFHFRLDEVEEPDRLLAVAPGWLPVRADGVPSSAGWAWPPFVELRFEEPPRSIAGRVLDSEGEPVAGALVWVEEPTLLGYSSGFPLNVEHRLADTTRMWHNVESGADGTFRLDGLLERSYRLRAVDRRSALFSEAADVRPGEEAVLRFPADATVDLRGTVVDRDGEPVEGVRLQVVRVAYSATTLEGQTWVDNARGAHAASDGDGAFRLAPVPLEGCELGISGDGIMGREVALELALDQEPLHLVVARECHVRIEVASADLATARVRFLDAAGERMTVQRLGGEYVYIERDSPLVDGKQTLAVPDSAATVLFLVEEEEVLRAPVHFTPDELNYLRP